MTISTAQTALDLTAKGYEQRTLANARNLLRLQKGEIPYDRMRGAGGAFRTDPLHDGRNRRKRHHKGYTAFADRAEGFFYFLRTQEHDERRRTGRRGRRLPQAPSKAHSAKMRQEAAHSTKQWR